MKQWIGLMLLSLMLGACSVLSITETSGANTLTGHIEGSDLLGGTMSVRYPEGWTATMDGLGGIQLASSPELLTGSGSMPAGEVAILLSIASKTTTDGSQPTTQSVLNSFMSQLTASGTSSPTFSAPQPVSISSSSGLQTEGSSQGDGLGLMVLERDRYFLVLMALVADDDLSTQQQMIEAIAASFEYQTPDQ